MLLVGKFVIIVLQERAELIYKFGSSVLKQTAEELKCQKFVGAVPKEENSIHLKQIKYDEQVNWIYLIRSVFWANYLNLDDRMQQKAHILQFDSRGHSVSFRYSHQSKFGNCLIRFA